jgi:hypothetical protein
MPDTPVDRQPHQDYPDSMETRVAILEHIAADMKEEFIELNSSIKELAQEMRQGFATMDAKFDRKIDTLGSKVDRQFYTLVVGGIILAFSLFGLIGHVGHWFG